jgi:hypothetical protein
MREVEAPQYRSMAAAELRRSGGGECRAVGRKITGHAAVFNRASRNLGGFIEVILPGAFTGALAEGGQVLCRYNHSPSFVIGDTNDRLNIWQDKQGLAYEVEPGPEHQWLLKAVERGDVRGSSFAFNMLGGGRDRWGLTQAGSLLREVQAVGQLVDVACVDAPAYPAAEASVRSAPAALRGALEARRAAWTMRPETAMRELARKRHPPGPVDPWEAQRILDANWRPPW